MGAVVVPDVLQLEDEEVGRVEDTESLLLDLAVDIAHCWVSGSVVRAGDQNRSTALDFASHELHFIRRFQAICPDLVSDLSWQGQ